jgi:hypothetical protein
MVKVLNRIMTALAAYTPAAAACSGTERRHRTADRRQRSMPGARDRRVEIIDRRGGAYGGA